MNIVIGVIVENTINVLRTAVWLGAQIAMRTAKIEGLGVQQIRHMRFNRYLAPHAKMLNNDKARREKQLHLIFPILLTLILLLQRGTGRPRPRPASCSRRNKYCIKNIKMYIFNAIFVECKILAKHLAKC